MIPQTVQAKIDALIGREGGYSNNPADKGGETMWGITIAVARSQGYTGPMAAMPRETAVAIYASKYWTQAGLDGVNAIDSGLANRLFDWGVNAGPARAGLALQRALNVLNRNGQDWLDLKPDGSVGTLTVQALQQLAAKRGADGLKVVRGMVQALQSVFYIECAEKDPSQEMFEYGWQLNRAFGV